VRAGDARKNDLKPWLQKQRVIPPTANAEFVCAMGDVPEVSQRPPDPERPVVCLDETSKQLIGETRPPIPAAPGRPARIDSEYERHGTANLFMLFEPPAGWRHVEVTDRRTKIDFAHVLRDPSDRYYPDAERIVLVMDNLNTHKRASLYEAFPAAEARRLAARFEVHHTPEHGSRLDLAETELSVLSRQCLSRRIDSVEDLTREIAAWERRRNESEAVVDWQFTAADARVKLKRLYPSIQDG